MDERRPPTWAEWNAAADDDARLTLLVRCAVLAPSGHNTQPWLFRVRAGALEVRADRTRALPVVDPDDRELEMSVGAAIAHLRIAAAHFRRRPAVQLLPDPDDPDLSARLRIDEPAEANDEATRLYEVMARRHTDRGPYVDGAVAEETLAALERAARQEGAWLASATAGDVKAALADLVAEGDRLQMGDRRFRRELSAWIHPNRTQSRDGMPGYAFGIENDLVSEMGRLVVRLFDTGKGQAAKDRELAEHSPALIVIGTPEDTSEACLHAGQALAHVWLEATARGLAMSFLNQPIELPELRPSVAETVGHDGFPQVLMRLGRPEGAREGRRTPRRPVDEVLLA
ncbi:MAG TPA: nitroreductase family protein [Sandaracinaceae bacterium LLY-WYZ-13_1]|nr:nitroreductase family protein [Sandaracinaceae bacterium LLY-WYZ-13_1]